MRYDFPRLLQEIDGAMRTAKELEIRRTEAGNKAAAKSLGAVWNKLYAARQSVRRLQRSEAD